MGKKIPDAQMDVTLNDIKNNANIYHICSAEPANYAGIAAVSLGSVAVDSADFIVGDGDTSGRKITVGQQTVTPTGNGDVTHIVTADSVNTRYGLKRPCQRQKRRDNG
jgi:hypothetical protein